MKKSVILCATFLVSYVSFSFTKEMTQPKENLIISEVNEDKLLQHDMLAISGGAWGMLDNERDGERDISE